MQKSVGEDADLIWGRTQESYAESRYLWDKCWENSTSSFLPFWVQVTPFCQYATSGQSVLFQLFPPAFCLLHCSLDDSALTPFCFTKMQKNITEESCAYSRASCCQWKKCLFLEHIQAPGSVRGTTLGNCLVCDGLETA